MNKKRPVKLPLLLIVWQDHSSNDNWIREGELDASLGLNVIHSVGWLKQEDDTSYTIVGGIDLTDGTVTSAQRVLKGTVISKKVLIR